MGYPSNQTGPDGDLFMLNVLLVAAGVIWGIPISALAVAGGAALVSTRARTYLRRNLIAE